VVVMGSLPIKINLPSARIKDQVSSPFSETSSC